jgi:hypothetical protein
VKEGLEEFDTYSLKALGDLLMQCVVSLKYSLTRAKDLLSAEWKAAGFKWLPSEAEALGITDYGWKNPANPENEQLDHWHRALHMRAGQLAAFIGQLMAQYEETHVPRFGERSEFATNPWLVWRKDTESSPVTRFVKGLTDDEFLTALMAKHIGELKAFNCKPPLTLPTDGDLDDIDNHLVVEETTEVGTWWKILLENFTRRWIQIDCLDLQSPDLKGEHKSRISDFSELDWQRLLYLAFCTASKEANALESSKGQAMALQLSAVTDRLDSISAAQMPMIDLLERIAFNVTAKDQKAAEKTLETALGSKICSFLNHLAWTNAVAAEVILHDVNFPNPGVGIGTLCAAFECELKFGLLTRFGTFLRCRSINYWPEGRMDDGTWWPQILKAGNMNPRLSMEKIAVALSSPRAEIGEFCLSEGVDLRVLTETIEYVKEYRNPHAHGGVLSFVQAQRIRETLLGISAGNGGVFETLVPRNVRFGNS